jgi:RNA polymerase-binding transcription factor DksA
MDPIIKNQLSENLIREAGHVLEEFYRRPLDEVLAELRMKCLIGKDTRDPVDLLHELHFSRLFYKLKSEAAVHVAKAIARFVDGGYGLCIHCGETIPREWLFRSPLVEYCSRCMVQVSPSHSGVSDDKDRYTYNLH